MTREMRAPTARSTRASTPTARARRASSTSGRATRCARLLAPDEFAVARAALRARRRRRISRATRGICASACRSTRSPQRLGIPLAGRARSALDAREGGAVRGAARARAPRPRRQDPDVVERARDRGTCPRGARARRAAHGPTSRARPPMRCARTVVARRPAARDAQGRARASQRVSRRPRVPARGAASSSCRRAFAPTISRWARAIADAAARRSSRTASTAASSSRATTTSGSSIARSPATTTRRRRATASRPRALIALGHLAAEPRYVDAGERAVRAFAPALAQSPGRLFVAARGARGSRSRRRRIGAARGRSRRPAPLGSARSNATLRPGVRVFNVAGVATARRALVKGPAPGRAAARGSAAARNACPRSHALPEIELRRSRALTMRRASTQSARRDVIWRRRVRSGTMTRRFHASLRRSLDEDCRQLYSPPPSSLRPAPRSPTSAEDLIKKNGCTACHADRQEARRSRVRRGRREVQRRRRRRGEARWKRSRRAVRASGARCRCRRIRRCPTPTSRRWSPTSSRSRSKRSHSCLQCVARGCWTAQHRKRVRPRCPSPAAALLTAARGRRYPCAGPCRRVRRRHQAGAAAEGATPDNRSGNKDCADAIRIWRATAPRSSDGPPKGHRRAIVSAAISQVKGQTGRGGTTARPFSFPHGRTCCRSRHP